MSQRTLTEADVDAIADAVVKKRKDDQFTAEEVFRVRCWVKKADKVATTIGYAVITVVVAGTLGALWVGVKKLANGGG